MFSGSSAFGYSVLTHEQLVDLVWDSQLKPLLLARYPSLDQTALNEAHAYAYGGAVIQDLGYYPFGNAFFSDLVHYARSGDFVAELIRQSESADEYAFALGALSHYVGDSVGHPGSVNQAVAIEYPKLRARYGNYITYDENKTDHLKVEFGFDMEQVARHRYASQQYHDYIGFQVAKPLLDRVFPVVYGLSLKQVMPNEDRAIGTFRWSVSQAIPEMTRVALVFHGRDLVREDPTFSRQKYLYRLSRADYQKQWGSDYQRPGWRTRLLAFFLRVLPPVGPLRALSFDDPTTRTENLYIASINASFERYRGFLDAVRAGTLQLANDDLDDGKPTLAGEYKLADQTYARWLAALAAEKFSSTDATLRQSLLDYYKNATNQTPAIQSELAALKSAPVLAY